MDEANACGFSAVAQSSQSPPLGSTGKRYLPSSLPFWKVNICICNTFKNSWQGTWCVCIYSYCPLETGSRTFLGYYHLQLPKSPIQGGAVLADNRVHPPRHFWSSLGYSEYPACKSSVKALSTLHIQTLHFGSISHSVVSNSLQPHGLQPARLLCPWDSPGKNPGVGSHSLLQGIFPTQGSNPGLLHYRQILLSEPLGNLLEFFSQTFSIFGWNCGCGRAMVRNCLRLPVLGIVPTLSHVIPLIIQHLTVNKQPPWDSNIDPLA